MNDYERGRHDALRDLFAVIQDSSNRAKIEIDKDNDLGPQEKIAILNTWISILNALKNFIEREERRLVTKHLNKGEQNND